MAEHPSLDELQEFAQGLLPPERTRRVVAHLLRGCVSCGAELLPNLVGEAPEDPVEDPGYDEALDRAFAAQHWHGPAALKVKAKARQALALTEAGGIEALCEASSELKGIAACEALLERSWALRHDKPQEMLDLANYARMLADHLSSEGHDPRKLADLRCRAWAALGNAYRVTDELDFADWALSTAAELRLQGTGDELLAVRLLDLQASLFGAQRRLPAALEALDGVYALHSRRGDDHLAGRALISKGIYTGHANDFDEAVRLLTEGLAMIDRKSDPELALFAIHNIAWFLMEGGHFRKARNLVWENRWRYIKHGGQIDQVKLRWLQGRIDAGMGNLAAAEEALKEALQGLEKAGMHYHFALAGLDLGSILLRRQRLEEARTMVLDATSVFLRLKIHREALKAVTVLHQVFEAGVEAQAILDDTIVFLRRIQYDPTLTLSAWFL